MFEVFFKSLLIGYSGAIMPGSLLTYTIDKSIKNGAKSGLLISIGHSILELFLVLLIFFGLAGYLGTETAKVIIGLVGGLVLVLFGFQMLRDIYLNKISINLDNSKNNGYGNILVGGAVISASNPYFIFWWAVVGVGLVMTAYNTFGIIGIVLFYTGHILSDITWYVFISVLISKTRAFINLKVYKIVIVILGICLVGFGLNFLVSSLRNIHILFQ